MKAAIDDLREARASIALDNPAVANQVVLRLQKAVELIAARPEIGRSPVDGTTREWSVPGLPYLIHYRVVGDFIEIVRVWHTTRERPKAW